jgi:hypothetical protein
MFAIQHINGDFFRGEVGHRWVADVADAEIYKTRAEAESARDFNFAHPFTVTIVALAKKTD